MKRSYWLIIPLLITNLLVFAQNKKPSTSVSGLDAAVEKVLKDWNVAGAAVAVVNAKGIVYKKGFGLRDIEDKKPVTTETLFAIGSCTKAFTASVLGILEEEGKLEFDKKVTDYLPGFSFYSSTMNEAITVKDLILHRTGLPRHDFSWYVFKSSSRDSLAKRIAYLEPNTSVRNSFQYNNFMYLLQGYITEKLTNSSWEDNVRTKIFQPLGMSRSNFSIAEMAKNSNAAKGYTVDNGTIKQMDFFSLDGIGPAGSINSSVEDMAQWVQLWINNGKHNDTNIFPEAYVQAAITGQIVMGGGLPSNENKDILFNNYGYGWMLNSYRGKYRVEHGGNIDGFSASTSFFPADSLGIIVLTNQNGSAATGIIRNLFADRFLQLSYTDWNKKQLDAKKKQEESNVQPSSSTQKKNTTPTHDLAAYEGLYHHNGYGSLDVYVKNDTLFATIGNDGYWLRHYHYDVFDIKKTDAKTGADTTQGSLLKLNFNSNETGDIDGFTATMQVGVAPLKFGKKIKTIATETSQLQKYTGEYELGGMIAKVYLKDNILYLFVPGQPEYETSFVGNHKFMLKKLDGYAVQFETEGDKVTAVNFIQPNGTFKAQKKK